MTAGCLGQAITEECTCLVAEYIEFAPLLIALGVGVQLNHFDNLRPQRIAGVSVLQICPYRLTKPVNTRNQSPLQPDGRIGDLFCRALL
jgi:hypothetical protein